MRISEGWFRFIRNQYSINRRLGQFLTLSLAILILVFSLWRAELYLSAPPSKGYEPRQYTECSDINANDYLCSRTSSESAKETKDLKSNADHSQHIPKEFIKDKRDVNAQEGMWRATNLLGYLTIIQAFIGLITVGVLGITLVQTRDILKEAKATTKEAGRATTVALETLELNKKSAIAEFQPYLEISKVGRFAGADPNWGGGTDFIVISFENTGKTPARNFRNFTVHDTIEEPHQPSRFIETRGGGTYIFDFKTSDGGEFRIIDKNTTLLDTLSQNRQEQILCPVDYHCENHSEYVSRGYLTWGPPDPIKLTSAILCASIDFDNSFPKNFTRRLYFEIRYTIAKGKIPEKFNFRIIKEDELGDQNEGKK